MAEYKATSEQWAEVESYGNPLDPSPIAGCSCLLELRARVEQLEAAERQASKVYEMNEPLQLTPEQAQQISDLLAPNSKPTFNPSQIGSSLVERVAKAISQAPWPDPALDTSNTHEGWLSEARAAIREVAAWMTSNPDIYFPPALVFALEQEAER